MSNVIHSEFGGPQVAGPNNAEEAFCLQGYLQLPHPEQIMVALEKKVAYTIAGWGYRAREPYISDEEFQKAQDEWGEVTEFLTDQELHDVIQQASKLLDTHLPSIEDWHS